MKRITIALFLSLLPLIAHAGNPKIAALVAKLSGDDMWENGWYDSASDLPRTASIRDVLDHYIGTGIMFEGTPYKAPYEIAAFEKVSINYQNYTAALIDDGFGLKIILILQGNTFPWARKFDIQ